MDIMNNDLRWRAISNCVNESCQLSDLHLLIGIYTIFPFAIITKREKSGIVHAEGSFVYLTKFILNSLNISYNLVSPKDMSEEKNSRENGSWTGLLGKLFNKEIDLYLGVFIVDYDLFNAFVVMENYFTSVIGMLGSVGQKREDNFFKFLLNVESTVWICLMVSFGCLVLTSTLVDLINFNGERNISAVTFNYFWIYFAALFCEGTSRTPSTRRNQGLLMTWLYCILVFSCGISGQFRAAIMTYKNDDNVQTIRDVADRPHLMPYILKDAHGVTTFRMSTLPQYQQLYRRMLMNPKETLLGAVELASPATLQKVMDGKGVFVAPTLFIKVLLSMYCDYVKSDRNFYLLDETFMPHYYAMFANRDLPPYLTGRLNDRFLTYRESGFVNRNMSQQVKNYQKCMFKNDESPDEVHLLFRHLSFLFVLTLLCHAFSLAVFFGEIFLSKCMTSSNLFNSGNSVWDITEV